MNNKLTQCISIKNVVWKSPRLLSCVEIKKKMFLLSNSNKGLLFEQSCVTQLVNDIMSFLCWVYVFSLLKEYRQRPHSDVLPTTATMYTHQLMITQSSLDIHSVYIPQSYLLLVWTWGHGRYSWLQNLCLLFECTLNSTDFHIPVSSISQLSFCQQCFLSDNIRTIVY